MSVWVAGQVLSVPEMKVCFSGCEYFCVSGFTSRIAPFYTESVVCRGIDCVNVYTLTHKVTQGYFIASLGGEAQLHKKVLTPDQVLFLVDAQKNGSCGLLLTEKRNVFYIHGAHGQVYVGVLFWKQVRSMWVLDIWKRNPSMPLPEGTRVLFGT